jgi:hypothetical protein
MEKHYLTAVQYYIWIYANITIDSPRIDIGYHYDILSIQDLC